MIVDDRKKCRRCDDQTSFHIIHAVMPHNPKLACQCLLVYVLVLFYVLVHKMLSRESMY
jgi:hypothetical protein